MKAVTFKLEVDSVACYWLSAGGFLFLLCEWGRDFFGIHYTGLITFVRDPQSFPNHLSVTPLSNSTLLDILLGEGIDILTMKNYIYIFSFSLSLQGI